MSNALIVFISDFGLQDAYVGIVKGVIAGISPQTSVVDLTHEIPPGDIRRAAILLWQSEPYFPDGTIYLGVVDPGVGSARKAIICRSARGYFVGPDNGLVSYLWRDLKMEKWEINQGISQAPSSNTFHGRDLFAPVAAKLANAMACESFGTPLENTISLTIPELYKDKKNAIHGEVLFSDRFGNMVTSIGRLVKTDRKEIWKLTGWWGSSPENFIDLTSTRLVVNQDKEIPFVDTFADIPSGAICALVGGSGLIEIAANRTGVASVITIQPGEKIILATAG